MKIKKAAALGLSLILMLTAFSACKPATNKQTENLKSTLDFGGQEIKFVYPPGYDMLNTDGKNPILVARDEKIKLLAEKYKCTVKQKEGKGSYWDVMANSIASGSPEGHVLVTQGNKIIDWVNAGALADLTPAMEETKIDFRDAKYSQVSRVYSNFNNKQYGFADTTPYPSCSIVVFNKRIFKDMQLEDPYKLVKEKKWTWDKVEEIAKKATISSPDGTVTQYGFGSWMHFDFVRSFANSNGGGIADYDKTTGEPVLTLTKPESVKAFDLLYKWTAKDKIARINNGSQTWDAIMKEFLTGNIAMLQSTSKVLQYAEEGAMKDDYGVVYVPIGPDVKDFVPTYNLSETYFVPTTYQDMTTKLLLFMDELFTLPKEDTIEDRVAARNISKLRDEESLKIYTEMTINTKGAIGDIYSMTGLDWATPSIAEICYQVMEGQSTPNEQLDKNKDLFVQVMKDKLGTLKFTGKD